MLLEWSGSPLASWYNWDTASHVRCNSKNFSMRFDIQMLCSIWFQWKLQWNILKWIFKFLDRERSEKKYSKVYDFYVNKVEELCCLHYVHWCSYLAIELRSLLVSEKKISRQTYNFSWQTQIYRDLPEQTQKVVLLQPHMVVSPCAEWF